MSRTEVTAPLAFKLAGAIIVVVLSFGFAHLWVLRAFVAPRLRVIESARSHELATHLAGTLVDALLVDDFVETGRRLDLFVKQGGVRYAFVVDSSGNVITHTFPRGVPTGLLLGSPSSQVESRLITAQGSTLRDITVPLAGARLGAVRIGIDESSAARAIEESSRILFLMVLCFLLLGVAGAVAYASLLARPIRAIARWMDEFQLDRPFQAPEIHRGDEIGVLAKRVIATLGRLESNHAELVRYRGQMQDVEKLASIGVLAAGVAHDVNNPLAGIRNCLQRIERAPERVEQTVQYAALMREATDHIEAVVRGLLDFARRRPSSTQDVAVPRVLEKAVRLCAHRFKDRAVTVTVTQGAGSLIVQGDEDRLTQVFVNLLLNAADAAEGGHVDVIMGERLNMVETEIRDSGVGIPQDLMEKVFDPFFSTKQRGRGTGLGLPVSRMIVEEHGGTLRGTSREGAGTSMVVSLRARDDSAGDRG